jgi:triosephosphate isomerase
VLGEDDQMVARKTAAALDAGLVPILCIGEVLSEREAGTTRAAIDRQLAPVLEQLGGVTAPPIILAYEPVWAIGTGSNATPQQAQDTHAFIRGRLREAWGQAGARLPILYGGSVNPDNCVAITDEADVDGVLVGGASLKSESFRAIARNVGG